MFKRRPLSSKKAGDLPSSPPVQPPVSKGSQTSSGVPAMSQSPVSRQAPGPRGPHVPGSQRPSQRRAQSPNNRSNRKSQNQQANLNRQGPGQTGKNPNQQHTKPGVNPNQQNSSQKKNNRNRQGNRPRGRGRPTPQYPAYIQRDLLLIATASAAATKGIEEVRLKFDPLAKKIPAHVTLLFPEHELVITREFLKTFPPQELPELNSLVFSSVQVHDEMYLWLIPDPEGCERLKIWHEALVKTLPSHTQEEVFRPHITLGYIPRSQTSEQAIEFAKSLVQLPLRLDFEKIMLEEFTENQNSTAIDTIKPSGTLNIKGLSSAPGPTPTPIPTPTTTATPTPTPTTTPTPTEK